MTELDPEEMEKERQMLLGMLPEGILDAQANFEFLFGSVKTHVEKLKGFKNRLPKNDFNLSIELVSLITELEIALYTVERKYPRIYLLEQHLL